MLLKKKKKKKKKKKTELQLSQAIRTEVRKNQLCVFFKATSREFWLDSCISLSLSLSLSLSCLNLPPELAALNFSHRIREKEKKVLRKSERKS